MRKRTKIERPYYLHKLAGDHIVRFYFDAKTKHPLMGITLDRDKVAGHQMTSSPEKTFDGHIKRKFIKFKVNPNPSEKRKESFYRKTLKRNIHIKRLSLKKKWVISKSDLKYLKNVDKKVIKNVRHAKIDS